MLELNPAGLFIHLVRPVVYLDHFALRRITEDEHLADRLVNALRVSSGSLALSWLNLGEYATVTDRDQRLLAEKLIDRILPAVFPLDVAPFDVHERQLARGPQIPQADWAIARVLVKRVPSISSSGVDVRLTATGVFDPLNHPTLIDGKDRLARLTQEALEKLRMEYASNADFRRDVMRAETTPATRSATNTLAVTRVMTATFFPDLRKLIKLNDAIDLQHAIVPTTFCDLVLLDGATCDMVERVRRRLPHVKLAAAFSGRGNGIDRFLGQLATSA